MDDVTTITDRELIILAAEALGLTGKWVDFPGMEERVGYQGGLYIDESGYWNPKESREDVFSLMCLLNISSTYYAQQRTVMCSALNMSSSVVCIENVADDTHDRICATQLAITRSAALIALVRRNNVLD